MNRKQAFIDFVNDLIKNCKYPVEMNEDVEFYWNYLKNSNDDEIKNPLFTENGKRLLICLQKHPEKETWKAREVADELGISSRSVSGGMRKLVNDGFVEKLNDNPVVYAITNKGKEITIEEELRRKY